MWSYFTLCVHRYDLFWSETHFDQGLPYWHKNFIFYSEKRRIWSHAQSDQSLHFSHLSYKHPFPLVSGTVCGFLGDLRTEGVGLFCDKCSKYKQWKCVSYYQPNPPSLVRLHKYPKLPWNAKRRFLPTEKKEQTNHIFNVDHWN